MRQLKSWQRHQSVAAESKLNHSLHKLLCQTGGEVKRQVDKHSDSEYKLLKPARNFPEYRPGCCSYLLWCDQGICQVSTFCLSCIDLVVKIPRIPLIVLVTAVLGGGLLSLCVISHVMLENTGESHGRQHAHHRCQRQHQTHHHTGKIHRADGIQRHWEETKRSGRGERQGTDKRSDGEMRQRVRRGDKDKMKQGRGIYVGCEQPDPCVMRARAAFCP